MMFAVMEGEGLTSANIFGQGGKGDFSPFCAKNSDLSIAKFKVVRTDRREGIEPVCAFFRQGKRSIFRDFVLTSFMDGAHEPQQDIILQLF